MNTNDKPSTIMLEKVWLRDENTRLSNEVIRLMAEVSELRGHLSPKPDKWSHLPEGGEWINNGHFLFHHATGADFTTRYRYDGKLDNPYANQSMKFDDGYPRITRAEAIVIFEKNQKSGALESKAPEPPATPAFKVGDMVKVVRKVEPPHWSPEMELTIGKVAIAGPTVDVDSSCFVDICGGWWYNPACLALATDEAGEKPVVDHIPDTGKMMEASLADVAAGRVRDANEAFADIESSLEASPTQPPMSHERFRQEAAIAAMREIIALEPDCDYRGVIHDAMLHANSLADAVFDNA